MSGICGAWNLRIPASSISPMLDALDRRGPDGRHAVSDGAVTFGHTLLATTPEALSEELPLRDGNSDCLITADARLDNRDELIRELSLPRERIIGDVELILHCYLRWKTDCPRHLLGDFAFAIWDRNSQCLFAARDHMGVRPFYYHWSPDQIFVFASSCDAVVSHCEVQSGINEPRIADYLADLEAIDLTSTFFENVFRLPPAHSIHLRNGQLTIAQYWELLPPPPLVLSSDAAYEEAFRAVFTRAVQCRLRSTGPVAAMLSGGADSSAVVAVGSRLLRDTGKGPLDTFSAIAPVIEGCLESETIMAASRMDGIRPHFVERPDQANGKSEFLEPFEGAEPFDGSMTLIRAVYAQASREGHKVVLDGVASDIALNGGNPVASLLRQLRFLAACRESFRSRDYWTEAAKPWANLLASAWAAFVPSSSRNWRRVLLQRLSPPGSELGQFVREDFGKRVKLPSRRIRLSKRQPAGQLADPMARSKSITHPNLTVARERYNRVASAYGIEPRDPFLDVRVLSFCLSLPADQLTRNGWPKSILRRAMRNLVPDSVAWRKGKQHLGRSFIDSVMIADERWIERLKTGRGKLKPYVKPEILDDLDQPKSVALKNRLYFELFYLLAWLERV